MTFSRLGQPQSSSGRIPEKPVSAPIVFDDQGNAFISLGNLADLEAATIQRQRKTKNGKEGAPYEGVDLIDVEGEVDKVIDVPSNAMDAAGRQLLAAASADGVIPKDGESLRAVVRLKLHLPMSRGWLTIEPVDAKFSIVRPQPQAPVATTPKPTKAPPRPPKARKAGK
ncbi:MAG: hypothetical protein JRJ69_10330 [Deltaproteobacteria bacterium]|nr:hypothetical protein [Deltaproteobacteria bacterium]